MFPPDLPSLGFFILLSNYLGMIPGFFSPTANINTTAACALIVGGYDARSRREVSRGQVRQALHGARGGGLPAADHAHRADRALARVLSLSIRLFGKRIRRGNWSWGFFSSWRPLSRASAHDVSGSFYRLHPGLYFLPAFDDVLCRGNRARPLIRRLTGVWERPRSHIGFLFNLIP